MLPCAPAVTTRELVERLGAALGGPAKLQRMPPVLLSVLGLAMPILRELKEMAYQWEEPFVVDDRRFRARFGVEATPLETGVRETAEWARKAFGEGAAAR